MISIINYLLSKIPYNNTKTLIGAFLVALAFFTSGLADVLTMIPESWMVFEIIDQAVEYSVQMLDLVSPYLNELGIPTIFIGLFHKWVKRVDSQS